MKPYAYAWIPLGFLAVAMLAHRLFGGFTRVDDARGHGAALELTPNLMMMGRGASENRQSEFRQRLWQVAGPACFLSVGSPARIHADPPLHA